MPDIMSANIEPFFEEQLVNIIGGCCGSTPAHIAAIAEKANEHTPRQTVKQQGYNFWGVFSGLDHLRIPHNTVQLRDAEASTDTDREEFKNALTNGEYEDAAEIARDILEGNTSILNIEIYDTQTINEKALSSFLDFALMNPYVARAPFFINSPDLTILETALKRLQGRSLAGPINLKDGDEDFINKARLIQRYGAAAVVTLIDEQGHALTNDRKIEIMKRIYQLLLKNNYPVDNVVIDPLVSKEDSFCNWIHDNCPGVILAL
jgi:5-methyltetrahydrofolate--homocysteine methyltransferase